MKLNQQKPFFQTTWRPSQVNGQWFSSVLTNNESITEYIKWNVWLNKYETSCSKERIQRE